MSFGILGYAVRTSSLGITFQRGTVEGFHLVSFADADYASKATDRRSASRGVVMCEGGAVSWHSKTQECMTLSTTSGVCGYVGHGDGYFVFEVGLVFHVAEG